MELNTIEESKNKLIVELVGDTHTIPNVLQKELWNDKDVVISGYNIEHPLVGKPHILVQTKSKAPRTALIDAVKRIKKDLDKFKSTFSKA